ncbi:hypothetical protein BpHYR1_032634 [Brachionus plicatilis]|uniref:Uncharacterized protein n=1 Tax=Brachionus plicatilis TaxID=10195 RepID=A0A3M7Q3P1_BRAPC|nr:hypothetical protein BpHYR1_032634 [Brachionus plicatilis]
MNLLISLVFLVFLCSLISSTSILKLSLSYLYLEKTPEHNFSTDIFIFHLISHCSSSLVHA